ncbi:hypothetical protein GCM10010174_50720 [Kutzneria viridogrisea]|uniref:Uncharacterized protein n=2 Tax=Kutzneria TaxID=43356 RepID=W5WDQ7_9PSEU|nr:hypothetical protein [Kutzneria albida]AHH99313.1 hypothetical protein KALB_5953 [Kutzneria albida DSM 43870]MBA8923133.1 hypothetical protein [Kutzneria viridogrisea]
MAVIFELVMNFGVERSAAEQARDSLATMGPVPVDERLIGLHPPFLRDAISYAGVGYVELAVAPMGVSWGLPHDRSIERAILNKAQLSALGDGLYKVLERLDGYQAAMVGWDPEGFVDLDELRVDWSEELRVGGLPGLVLSSEARLALGSTTGFHSFAQGFEWIPYAGEPRGNET